MDILGVTVAVLIFLLRFKRLMNMYKVLLGLILLCASFTFDKAYLAFYKRSQPDGFYSQVFGENNDGYACVCGFIIQVKL